MAIGVLGVIYASIIAIKQKDFKRLVAFSSIAHVSLITVGLFSGNLEGVQGAIIQMFNHGINAVGLFFVLEVITQRTNTRLISELGGIVHKAPLLSICFMIILLGSIALPLTNGFPGEFLILLGLYKYNMVLAAIAGLTIVFGAVYMLRMYKTIMLGETRSATENFKDLSFAEMAVLFPLCILVIGLGLYPNFILSISEPLAIEILNYVTLKGASFSALLN
jgi:NADH-quinone oxidoreductase subunit M